MAKAKPRIGAKVKRGKSSYPAYRAMLASVDPHVGDDNVEPPPTPPPPISPNTAIKKLKVVATKARKDVEKKRTKIKELNQSRRVGKVQMGKLKSVVKAAVHQLHVDKKFSRQTMKKTDEQHQREMKQQAKQHEEDVAKLKIQIDEAYEPVDKAETKAATAEEERITGEAALKAQLKLRTERTRWSDTLTQLKKQMTESLEAEKNTSKKDIAGMQAYLDHQIGLAHRRNEEVVAIANREKNVLKTELAKVSADEEGNRKLLQAEVVCLRSKVTDANRDKRVALKAKKKRPRGQHITAEFVCCSFVFPCACLFVGCRGRHMSWPSTTGDH